jgi:hypothetical protein
MASRNAKRKRVGVGGMFAEEPDTTRTPVDARMLALCVEDSQRASDVDALVPLDAVPTLAVAEAQVPWSELGERATQLVKRVDGNARTMDIVTGLPFAPSDAARELADLARRGIVHLRVA